jgi:transketolase
MKHIEQLMGSLWDIVYKRINGLTVLLIFASAIAMARASLADVRTSSVIAEWARGGVGCGGDRFGKLQQSVNHLSNLRSSSNCISLRPSKQARTKTCLAFTS